MKKLTLSLCLAFALAACDPSEETNNTNLVETNVEEGKQALEDNGISMLTEIENFKDDPALAEIESFIIFLSSDEESSNTNNKISSKINASLKNAIAVKSGSTSVLNYASKQTKIVKKQEDSLQDEFDELVGNYTWNESEGIWNEPTENTENKIIYTVTNNENKTAVLTVSNFTVFTHTSGEEMPTSMRISLKVDGNEIMSHVYSASFENDENAPTNMSETITLGALSYSSSMSIIQNTKASMNSSLKLGDKTILGIGMSIEGQFEELNENGDTDMEANEVFQSASLNFTMLDATISILGNVPSDIEFGLTKDEQVQLMNDHLSILLTVGNKKISEGEFYKKNSDEIDILFVFSDNTKSDMGSYFEVGFDDLENKLEEVSESLEDRFESDN